MDMVTLRVGLNVGKFFKTIFSYTSCNTDFTEKFLLCRSMWPWREVPFLLWHQYNSSIYWQTEWAGTFGVSDMEHNSPKPVKEISTHG